MQSYHVTLGEGGRVVVPAEYRKALGLQPGDDLIIRMEDSELRLYRRTAALQKIRSTLQAKSRKTVNHTDDFLVFRKGFYGSFVPL